MPCGFDRRSSGQEQEHCLVSCSRVRRRGCCIIAVVYSTFAWYTREEPGVAWRWSESSRVRWGDDDDGLGVTGAWLVEVVSFCVE